MFEEIERTIKQQETYRVWIVLRTEKYIVTDPMKRVTVRSSLIQSYGPLRISSPEYWVRLILRGGYNSNITVGLHKP